MSAIPITRPQINVQTKRRSKHRTYVTTRECILWGIVFFVVATFVFGASSLTGHVLVESARRQTIQANQRLRTAVAAQSTLSREIEALSDERELVAWATRNGFVAPDQFPGTSRRPDAIVASR
jgi:cell division protein FtsB